MEFKIGQIWKTRDGSEMAEITNINSENRTMEVKYIDETGKTYGWGNRHLSGAYRLDGVQSSLDLVVLVRNVIDIEYGISEAKEYKVKSTRFDPIVIPDDELKAYLADKITVKPDYGFETELHDEEVLTRWREAQDAIARNREKNNKDTKRGYRL